METYTKTTPNCPSCQAYQQAGLQQEHWSLAWILALPRGWAKGLHWGWTGAGLKLGPKLWTWVAVRQRRCRFWHPAVAPAKMGLCQQLLV